MRRKGCLVRGSGSAVCFVRGRCATFATRAIASPVATVAVTAAAFAALAFGGGRRFGSFGRTRWQESVLVVVDACLGCRCGFA